MFEEFHLNSKFDTSMNSTFITLILPKRLLQKNFQLSPHYLGTGVHKIILEELSLLLSDVMDETIFMHESAFVGGRKSLTPATEPEIDVRGLSKKIVLK